MNMICGIDMHDMHLLENREKIQLYETIIYAKLYQTITFAKKHVGSFLPRGRAQQRNRPTTSTMPSMDGRTPWLQPVKFTYQAMSYE